MTTCSTKACCVTDSKTGIDGRGKIPLGTSSVTLFSAKLNKLAERDDGTTTPLDVLPNITKVEESLVTCPSAVLPLLLEATTNCELTALETPYTMISCALTTSTTLDVPALLRCARGCHFYATDH
jgi:hypothetical protein